MSIEQLTIAHDPTTDDSNASKRTTVFCFGQVVQILVGCLLTIAGFVGLQSAADGLEVVANVFGLFVALIMVSPSLIALRNAERRPRRAGWAGAIGAIPIFAIFAVVALSLEVPFLPQVLLGLGALWIAFCLSIAYAKNESGIDYSAGSRDS